MRFSLIPKEVQFFDLLERVGRYAVEGAQLLEDLARNYVDVEAKVARLNGLEHACDEVTHATLEKLETTFITPFDREDIHELALRMDDVLDMITAAASRLPMYRIDKPRPEVIEFAVIIVQQATAVASAVAKLRDTKLFSQIANDCIEVHRLENQADDVVRKAVGGLFERETNAIELVRWKEIYQTLETVTDCGEDVANVIQGIVVKNA